ncbi:unnamed protein product, partial [Urochloa humidicola]
PARLACCGPAGQRRFQNPGPLAPAGEGFGGDCPLAPAGEGFSGSTPDAPAAATPPRRARSPDAPAAARRDAASTRQKLRRLPACRPDAERFARRPCRPRPRYLSISPATEHIAFAVLQKTITQQQDIRKFSLSVVYR